MRAPLGAAIAVLLAGVLVASGHAAAGTWFVNASGGSDANSCADAAHPCLTINGAIAKAADGDTIEVATGSYTSAADPVVDLTKNVALNGGWNASFTSQTGLSTIDGQNARRAVIVDSLSATMVRFHLLDGFTTGDGGNLFARGGATLVDSVVENGHADLGGGIATLSGSALANVRILRSMIWANVATTGGGGIEAMAAGTVTIVDSTVAGNQGGTRGGGIDASDSPAPHVHTFSATIVSNSATTGGGIYDGSGDVSILNTLLADNVAPGGGPDCAAPIPGNAIFANGYNLIGDTSGCSYTNTFNLLNVSPGLDDTANDNGGPTETIALLDASPAIDAGDPAGCVDDTGAVLTVDQRGFDRSVDGRCDIGAYEAGPPANDDFADAIALSAADGSTSVSNIRASVEPNEPEHAGDEGGASVWYSWTPATTGTAVVSVTSAGFDPLLAVYTGGSLGSLVRVASNDDRADGVTDSMLCFAISAATTYRIAVDGYAGSTGTGTLQFAHYAGTAPCATLPPTVTGPVSPQVGDTLTSDTGSWINPSTPARQWLRCQAEVCNPIAGATGAAYTTVARDVGTSIRLDVTEGGALSTSDPTVAVGAAAPTTTPANGRIYYDSNPNPGNYDIYSILPGQPGSKVQLTSGPGTDAFPVVSPDGMRVAFLHSGEIETMSPDGSGVTDTGLAGSSPTWSPDGSRIAFVFNQGSSVGAGYDSVGVADADGSHAEVLLSDVAGTFHDVAWSPDGRKLAVAYRQPGGRFNIGLIGADGRGGFTDLTHETTTDAYRPAWSPDSNRIAYVRGPVTGGPLTGDLVVVNADGSNPTTLITGNTLTWVAGASWSPDGSTLVADYGLNLWTVRPDGSQLTQLTNEFGRHEVPSWARAVSYQLTVALSGGGSGTVSSAPGGISCAGSCAASYADGTSVTLTAAPGAGSTFSGWTGACSGTGSCTVTMIGARSVGAAFTAAPSGGGGSGGGGGGGSGLAADLAVDGSVTPTTANQGDTLVWTFHVVDANLGPAVDAYVDFAPSPNLTYVSSTTTRGPGCSLNNGKLHCYLDWLSGDASKVTLTITTTVATAGDYSVSATVGQLIPDSNQANNTVVVKASTPPPPPPPPPPSAAKPVIGAPVASPQTPTAGKRFTVSFAVTRSDTGRSLTGGSASAVALVGKTLLPRTFSYSAGKAHLSLAVPKKDKGKLLTLKLTIHLGGRATTRTATYRIR